MVVQNYTAGRRVSRRSASSFHRAGCAQWARRRSSPGATFISDVGRTCPLPYTGVGFAKDWTFRGGVISHPVCRYPPALAPRFQCRMGRAAAACRLRLLRCSWTGVAVAVPPKFSMRIGQHRMRFLRHVHCCGESLVRFGRLHAGSAHRRRFLHAGRRSVP